MIDKQKHLDDSRIIKTKKKPIENEKNVILFFIGKKTVESFMSEY